MKTQWSKNLRGAAKAVPRGKFIEIHAYIKQEKPHLTSKGTRERTNKASEKRGK